MRQFYYWGAPMDPKYRLLFAICEEYDKAVPDISSITAGKLDMEEDVFFWAFVKLLNERFISSSKKSYSPPMSALPEDVLPTLEGLKCAEWLGYPRLRA